MPMRLRLALICLALLWQAAAFAAKQQEPGTNVEMPYLMAPMTVDGKLVAYAYISSQIIAVSPNAAVEIRLRVPYIQDAFVRDVNARPVARTDDPQTVDREALMARLLADAKREAGADKVAGIRFTNIQIAPLRPNP